MGFRKKNFEEPKLVVIPIVDVLLAVFLFLAILAFKTPLVSIPVHLPKGEGVATDTKILSVVVDKDGKLLIGGKVVTLDQLLEQIKKEKPQLVNLMADEKTPYGVVAKLLSSLRETGVQNVNLVLEQKKGR